MWTLIRKASEERGIVSGRHMCRKQAGALFQKGLAHSSPGVPVGPPGHQGAEPTLPRGALGAGKEFGPSGAWTGQTGSTDLCQWPVQNPGVMSGRVLDLGFNGLTLSANHEAAPR